MIKFNNIKFCYIKGLIDSSSNRILKDDNENFTSHFLISCSKTVNAYASKSWQEAMKQIYELEAIIQKNKKRIDQLKYKNKNNCIRRNDKRIALLEQEITQLKVVREEIIRETFEMIFEAKYLIESKKVEPYLRAASKRVPAIDYTIELENMPYKYTVYEAKDIGYFNDETSVDDEVDNMDTSERSAAAYV